MSMERAKTELISECFKQESSCQYTATSLYIWQKVAWVIRILFIVFPIILSVVASLPALKIYFPEYYELLSSSLAIAAGFFPAIYIAFDMNINARELGKIANDFTNLRDRFHQAATIKSNEDYGAFNAHFEQLMDRMDSLRMNSPTPPEWCYKIAKKKIERGDYKFQNSNPPDPDWKGGPRIRST